MFHSPLVSLTAGFISTYSIDLPHHSGCIIELRKWFTAVMNCLITPMNRLHRVADSLDRAIMSDLKSQLKFTMRRPVDSCVSDYEIWFGRSNEIPSLPGYIYTKLLMLFNKAEELNAILLTK